ncbi:MAG: TIGR01212 family radical SAM protein, partial [Bacilli bacterium]
MNPYINQQHYYNTLDSYLKNTYQSKVFKVPLSGPFSCPNRDGTIGVGGCAFCTDKASGEFAGNRQEPLSIQFEKIKTALHQKWKVAKYIVYFQANTNTYAPLYVLKQLFEEAICLDKDIVAISIATRPDCLKDEVIKYLAELNQRIPVWIELGLQTIHETTRQTMRIGYFMDVFSEAVTKLHAHHIDVVVHIINGLPNETKEMMLETARALNQYPLQGIKIHSLYLSTDSD